MTTDNIVHRTFPDTRICIITTYPVSTRKMTSPYEHTHTLWMLIWSTTFASLP